MKQLPDKVRILTIKGKPWGYIVNTYPDPVYSHYASFYWVRLDDGALIKDLSVSEIEQEYERIQAKCKHKFGKSADGYKRCPKCNYHEKVSD